jgi:AcrR family transcriptional regulator
MDRTMTRAEQAEHTRQLVLDTAQRLFAEQGYDATSLQMIADAMGVTKANVYYYFHTKAEILTAITSPALAAVEALFDSASQIRGKRERARHVVAGIVDVLVATRAMAAIGNSDPAIRRHKDMHVASEQIRQRGLQVLFGDNPTLDEQIAYQLLNAVPDIIPMLSDLSDDELRDVLTKNCLHILRIPS